MATLQKIRNHGGLLVGIVFVALAAFLLGDAFRSGNFGNDAQVVGEIDGNEIHILEFQRKVDELSEVYKMNMGTAQLDEQVMMQVRSQVWSDLEFANLMQPACEDLGLQVTADELFDIVQGNNVSPIIQQMFTDPQTGQFNKAAVLNFLQLVNNGQVTQQQYAYWQYVEKLIKRQRLEEKYDALVGKGLYVNSLEAKNSLHEKQTLVNFDYVKLPYSSISDSLIKVSSSDLKSYYNAHKENYAREAARTIQYVVLPIEPTEADQKETLEWIQAISADFKNANDNSQFVNINSDMAFDASYHKKADLDSTLAAFAFSANVGEMYGPVKDGAAYKMVKLDDRSMVSDSASARHILINPQTVGSLDAANALADSLKSLIETKKASFDELATRHSVDTGSASKGGDLGWFGRNQMVKVFEDAVFNGEVNKIYVVTSQFGVHIIQPTGKGKVVEQVRLAELVKNIEPSAKTEDDVYAHASKLVTSSSVEAYDNEVKEMALNSRTATLSEGQSLVAGLQDSRSLVKAAFTAEDINDFLQDYEGTSIFKFGDSFVVARLKNIQPKGYAEISEVSPSIEKDVVKIKKGEQLAAKMQGADLNAIASSINSSVQSVEAVRFGVSNVPSLGQEPKVAAAAASLAQGAISKPIAGNTAVYVVKNTSTSASTPATDDMVHAEQARMNSSYAYRLAGQGINAWKENVEIVDNRVKFF
ncbi:MAG: SurA N-terminal domain-containing protein [Mangrovibacterium sp.]